MNKDYEIETLKKGGAKIVGCFPIYPPLELIHSLGLTPVVLWGLKGTVKALDHANQRIQVYACSVVRHLTEFILSEKGENLDGILMYNACDSLRNLPEILACGLAEQKRSIPIVKIHIPMAPQTQTRTDVYLKAKIYTLISDLEKAFGVTFSETKFRRSIELYREMRRLVMDLESHVAKGHVSYSIFSHAIMRGYCLPVEDQITALKKILDDLPERETDPIWSGERIVISGILPPPSALIDAMEGAGLRIVGNDIATQKRSYDYTPSGLYDPGDYYYDFYQHHIPCPTLLYTADRRSEWIKELIQNTGASGFIFIGEKFCEYEYFEFPYLEQQLRSMGIAVSTLEISIDDEENCGSFVTRIEAFAEMLRSLRKTNKGGLHV